MLSKIDSNTTKYLIFFKAKYLNKSFTIEHINMANKYIDKKVHYYLAIREMKIKTISDTTTSRRVKIMTIPCAGEVLVKTPAS